MDTTAAASTPPSPVAASVARTDGTSNRVCLVVDPALVSHERRLGGAPRNLVVAELHKPIHYSLVDHADCIVTALRKYHHELNDTLYFSAGAMLVNAVELVVALVAPAHWLAATCVLAFAWFVLALTPYALSYAPRDARALTLYRLLPLLRWSGLTLTLAYAALLVVWCALAPVSLRWRLSLAGLQALTCVLQFNVVVALANLEDAFYGWVSAFTTMRNLQTAAERPEQRQRMTEVGRRVGDAHVMRVKQQEVQKNRSEARRRTGGVYSV